MRLQFRRQNIKTVKYHLVFAKCTDNFSVNTFYHNIVDITLTEDIIGNRYNITIYGITKICLLVIHIIYEYTFPLDLLYISVKYNVKYGTV